MLIRNIPFGLIIDKSLERERSSYKDESFCNSRIKAIDSLEKNLKNLFYFQNFRGNELIANVKISD
jgi:hypothetical protein